MLKRLFLLASLALLGVIVGLDPASAVEGLAHPWQINLQDPASPVMDRVNDFHNLLLVIQIGIVLLVMGILGYVVVRFNAKRNPVASKTTHNTMLEVIWTALPVVILVVIAIPGMRLLYFADKAHDYDLTLKVTGHQWYWSYSYPSHGDFTFDSVMVPEDDLKEGQHRLLSVDNRIVLPIDTNVQILTVADDVIHSWAVPSLGIKVDATPGRTNERWVRIEKEGTYYGMCSELCGVNHAFMPIEIQAVSKEDFAQWVEQAKQQFATNNRPNVAWAKATSQAQSVD